MSNKAIFLDRDDTLIEDVGYINHPDQVKLLDGVAEALIELNAMGYKLVVVSNQSAVARGIVTKKVVGEIHGRLKQLLAEKNASLDRIYYCPYHPEGIVAKYRKESNCRKPNPGMLLAAADEMALDLGESWMIGNSSRDIEAGLRAGCKTILVDSPSHQTMPEPGQPRPDYRAVNLKEAINIVKKHLRSHSSPAPAAQPPSTGQTQTLLEPAPQEPKPVSQSPQVLSQNSEPLSQAEQQQPQSEQAKPEPDPTKQEIHPETTEYLLNSILDQLKSMQRNDMFEEFSITRFIAGIIQMLVLLCLLIIVWLLMSPNMQDNTSVLIVFGFAIVLQLMSLTFYIMQGRK